MDGFGSFYGSPCFLKLCANHGQLCIGILKVVGRCCNMGWILDWMEDILWKNCIGMITVSLWLALNHGKHDAWFCSVFSRQSCTFHILSPFHVLLMTYWIEAPRTPFSSLVLWFLFSNTRCSLFVRCLILDATVATGFKISSTQTFAIFAMWRLCLNTLADPWYAARDLIHLDTKYGACLKSRPESLLISCQHYLSLVELWVLHFETSSNVTCIAWKKIEGNRRLLKHDERWVTHAHV